MSNESPSQADSFQLQMIETLLRTGLYLPTSSYFINGEVTSQMAGDLSRALHILDNIGEPITIHLSTPGGDMGAGLAMYDSIRECKSNITIVGHGEVMSMGACILQAADRRLLMPNSLVLVHVGYGGTNYDLPENTVRQAVAIKKCSEVIYDIIAKRSGTTKGKLLDKFRYDSFFTAKEACRAKLADGIRKPQA